MLEINQLNDDVYDVHAVKDDDSLCVVVLRQKTMLIKMLKINLG